MTPRKPYRSPFWRPETEGSPFAPPSGSGRTPSAPEAAPAPLPAPRAPKRSADERSVAYAASDLALFGRLMASDGRTRPTDPSPVGQPAKVPGRDAARPKRDAARATGSYSDRDTQLFQGLESSYAGTRQEPKAAAPSASNVYAQGDLDAFAALMRFGR